MNPLPSNPTHIATEEELDELLTRPSAALVKFIQSVRSPLVILGAGGKMGPTLAVMARRAAIEAGHPLDILAVSRFSDDRARNWLESNGIQILTCDLLDAAAMRQLPDSDNVLCLAGLKFGTGDQAFLTWAVNTLIPANVGARYPTARIVALSTGNVYPMTAISGGGSEESDPLTPVGEYPNAAVGRERIFEFHSHRNGTPMTLLRLNYAVELRYGVLVDIALKVFNGLPVDLTMGHFNCIWQADANERILLALAEAKSPPTVLNLTGPRILRVRDIASSFGKLLDRPVHLTGTESHSALLNNPARGCRLWGEPPTSIDRVIEWTAHWIRQGGRLLNKPTHFEVRDGRY